MYLIPRCHQTAIFCGGGKAKRIPPPASVMVIFAAQYIRSFIPGGIFFFTVTLKTGTPPGEGMIN
jgi:hypothetical protein